MKDIVDLFIHFEIFQMDQPVLLPMYSAVRLLATFCKILQRNNDMWQLMWTKQILHFYDNWHIIQQLPRPEYLKDGPWCVYAHVVLGGNF